MGNRFSFISREYNISTFILICTVRQTLIDSLINGARGPDTKPVMRGALRPCVCRRQAKKNVLMGDPGTQRDNTDGWTELINVFFSGGQSK